MNQGLWAPDIRVPERPYTHLHDLPDHRVSHFPCPLEITAVLDSERGRSERKPVIVDTWQARTSHTRMARTQRATAPGAGCAQCLEGKWP